MNTRTRWTIYRWTYRMFYLFGLVLLLSGMLLSMISSPAQASGPRTVQQTATSRPQFKKQPESRRPVKPGESSSQRPSPSQPQLRMQGVGQPQPTLDPTLGALPPGTGSVRFLTPDTAVCMLGPGTVEVTVEVSLPAGVSANLQTSYRIAEPVDLRTDPVYSYQTVEDGDRVTISGAWPGVRPGDSVVEVHFGAVLLDPGTGNPISNGAGMDYYWYPWYCTGATPPPPTIIVGQTETVTPTATQTVTGLPPTVVVGETETATPTATETEFPTAVSPTEVTITATVTETSTATATVTTVPTSSSTPTVTELPPTVQVSTATSTPTVTSTWTPTVTETATPTVTQQPPTVQVETATYTPTITSTVTETSTPTMTQVPPTVQVETATFVPTATFTRTPTRTRTSPPPTVEVAETATNTPPPTLTVQGPTAVSPTEETVPTVGQSQPTATATLERPTPIVIVVTATSEIPVTGGGQPTSVLGGEETPTEQAGPLEAPAPNEESLIPVTGADLAHQPLSAATLPFWQKLTTYMGLLMLGVALIMQGLSRKH